jgi:hypothetical protein
MTSEATSGAIVGVTLMLAVAALYLILARRYRLLWHPVSIFFAVGIVGVLVSVLGVLLFGEGIAAVPAMVRRSALGGFGWGLVIAASAWVVQRAHAWWTDA